MSVRIQDQTTRPIQLQRGWYLPELFTAALKEDLSFWIGTGLASTSTASISLNFRFSVALLNGLSRVSQQMGLRINISKTIIMFNAHVPLNSAIVGSSTLEILDEYIPRTHDTVGRSNFEKEMNRRIQVGGERSGNFMTSFRPKSLSA
ncbi:jg3064 [Pararge aegeria aegeria]|uniref:Jg3064 protein n=1 Tax=Pararge aegeria aegeria TaxID=348720 RepID=A0A8S4S243_9NEOP|nr:jg3064 [Pararge aegeria aegeria]